MDIILTKANTTLNKLVRKHTNSNWGHAALSFDNDVYHFDYKNKSVQPLDMLLADKNIEQVELYHAHTPGIYLESVNLYKERFESGEYDINALIKLYKLKDRNYKNLQKSMNHFTCCSLLAKTLIDVHNEVGIDSPLDLYNHWSQAIPEDFTKLEFVGRLK